MAAQWFVNFCGDELGPMTSAELRELAEVGGVQPDTLVRKGVDGNWVPAERVKGLFSAPEPRAAIAPPPAPEWSTSLDPPVASPPALPQRERARQTTAEINPPPLPTRRGTKFWVFSGLAVLLSFLLVVASLYVAHVRKMAEKKAAIRAQIARLESQLATLHAEHDALKANEAVSSAAFDRFGDGIDDGLRQLRYGRAPRESYREIIDESNRNQATIHRRTAEFNYYISEGTRLLKQMIEIQDRIDELERSLKSR